MAFPQVLGKSIPQGTTTHLAQSQSLGNRRDDEIRIAEGVEGDKRTPSENTSATSVATWRASRVLPTPPAPVRVTWRMSDRSSRAAASAVSCAPDQGIEGSADSIDDGQRK